MENQRASSSIIVAGFVAVVCLLTLAAHSARAQQTTPGGPPPPGQRDPFGEVRERQQREAQLRSAEMLGAVKSKDRRGAQAAAEQLREDFRNIQILRNKLVRHLQSEKPLDYKFIAAETGEVNRRAGRMQTHLLREVAANEKKATETPVEIGDEQLKDALVTMCKRIDSFTESPVFKVPEVVNVEQSAKANRDLRHIILLSGGIRRTAERLNKSHKK
ncbi:MAG TPA: hypothetical protein VGB76_00170 [Pyrinomonadaceae bacterium]|jgi:hypothetical protein